MVYLSIIWGIFALMFLALGCFQWKMAGKSISHFQIKQPIPGEIQGQVRIMGVDFTEFVDKFNSYIDYYNQTSKKQNKAQAIGYWVASFTAIFSLALALVS
jgi:hypothetical protein